MTLAQTLTQLASEITLCAPDQSRRLHEAAAKVRRIELALDELVDDSREQAEAAERGVRAGNVIPMRGTFW